MIPIDQREFRYFLTYENNKVELQFAPDGWDKESNAKFSRNIYYWALVRSYSLPLKFVFDGKDILRYAFGKDGMEAGVELEVQQRQKLWDYKTIFKGDLDFSKPDYDTTYFSVPLMESGLGRDIKAKENAKFEFDLIGPDIVTMELPGVEFNERGQFLTKFVDTSDLNSAKKFTVGIDYANNGINSNFLIPRNTLQRNAADTDDFSGDAFILGNRTSGVSVRFTGRIKGNAIVPPSESENLQLIFMNTVTKVHVFYVINANYTTGSNPFDVTFDFTYNLPAGQGLVLYSRANSGSTSASFTTVTEGDIYADFTSFSDPSECKGMTMFSLYKRLLSRISPTSIPNSSLLTGKWKDLIVTSGSGIRELDKQSIKTTFKDFFDTVNAIEDAGFGDIDNQTRIETKDFFMRNVLIADLGEVQTCNIMVAEDLVFNNVVIGYQDGNTEDVDGLKEFNSGQNWNLPLTRVQKEQSYVSPYRADQYGIEQLRVTFNITKQATSDVSGDNDTFMIDCYLEDGIYKPILGSSYTSVTGIPNPDTSYNLRLSPKQNLLRHSGYLRSILDLLDGRFIEFGSAEKNAELATVNNGVSVVENQSIAVFTLGGKYFRPYIANILPKAPINLFDLMSAKPYGYLQFSFKGVVMKAYPMETQINLALNTPQEFSLLLKDDSNMV